MNNELEFIRNIASQVLDRISWNIGDALTDTAEFHNSFEWEQIQDEVYYQLRNAYITGRAMANREGQNNG